MTSQSTSSRLAEAFRVAAEKFAGKTKKGGSIPYISHLMGVCAIALEHGAGEDEAVAALFHDMIEDVRPPEEARAAVAAFGPEVLRIVEGCSDSSSHPKPPWRERKERYIAHLETADRPVLLVSAADKLHNARAINADLRQYGDSVWKAFNATQEEELWYYRELIRVFEKKLINSPALVMDIKLAITEMERLASRITWAAISKDTALKTKGSTRKKLRMPLSSGRTVLNEKPVKDQKEIRHRSYSDVSSLLGKIERVGRERMLNTSLTYLFYPGRGSARFDKPAACSIWGVRCPRPMALPISPAFAKRIHHHVLSDRSTRKNYFEISIIEHQVYLDGDPPFDNYGNSSRYGLLIDPDAVTPNEIATWFEHISFIYRVQAIDNGPRKAPSFK